jgi:hypothetical protein
MKNAMIGFISLISISAAQAMDCPTPPRGAYKIPDGHYVGTGKWATTSGQRGRISGYFDIQGGKIHNYSVFHGLKTFDAEYCFEYQNASRLLITYMGQKIGEGFCGKDICSSQGAASATEIVNEHQTFGGQSLKRVGDIRDPADTTGNVLFYDFNLTRKNCETPIE